MLAWILFGIRIVLLVTAEWWGPIMSVLFATLGLAPDAILAQIFGPEWEKTFPSFLLTVGPTFVYAAAVLTLGIWVYFHFFGHARLKKELRQAIDDLNSDNVHLRMHAIADIIEIIRKSRRLHQRGLDALSLYLRERHPAPTEQGREVTLQKQRFGPPNATSNQHYQGDLHEFAHLQHQLQRQQIAPDAQAVLEALTRRRRYLFEDPRVWVDLSNTNLPSANLEKAPLSRFSFVGANLYAAEQYWSTEAAA